MVPTEVLRPSEVAGKGPPWTMLQTCRRRCQVAATSLMPQLIINNAIKAISSSTKRAIARCSHCGSSDTKPCSAWALSARTSSLAQIPYLGQERAEAIQTAARSSTGSLQGPFAEQLVRHLVGEVRLRERHLGGGEGGLRVRGDVLHLVQDRPVRVRAHLEAGAVLALVHVGVHVAHDRVLDVALGVREAGDRWGDRLSPRAPPRSPAGESPSP